MTFANCPKCGSFNVTTAGVCANCGEDFAKYIVSRNCNVSDVSITQDVLTDVKTPRSIENNNPDYYKDDVGKWIPIASGRLAQIQADGKRRHGERGGVDREKNCARREC